MKILVDRLNRIELWQYQDGVPDEPFQSDLGKEAAAEIERLQAELDSCRRDAALVIHALDCAFQLAEVLLAFTPSGSPLHPNVATAKGALDQAWNAIRGRK